MSIEVKVGGVYSIAQSRGHFGIVKVLAHEREANTIWVHTYRNRFEARPRSDQPAGTGSPLQATLGQLVTGIMALPVTMRVFEFWQPQFLGMQELDENESFIIEMYGEGASPWNDLIYP